MEKQIIYTATGVVLGNYWGGGQGSYKARPLHGITLAEIRSKAEKGIADGSLDGGMCFESLVGAALDVVKTTRIEIDGDEYMNEQEETLILGELSESQVEFLLECL